MGSNSEGRPCEGCESTNTYLSEAGYNTVVVCRSCSHESHSPWGMEYREWLITQQREDELEDN